MPNITFEGQTIDCASTETLLDSFTRHGIATLSSCRSGVCQTCMMRAAAGRPPAKSQEGLKPTLASQGYFLPCVCFPTEEMEIVPPGDDVVQRTDAVLVSRERLNSEIARLLLRPRNPFEFRAGQFVHLTGPGGLIRSYSVANVPDESGLLELHVRLLAGGAMSSWLHHGLEIGETVEIAGPSGSCFYTPERPDQGLLLIGTGSGLAPLHGIIHDALQQGHTGPIHLYHGSWNPDGLYLVDELRSLAAEHEQFDYTPCVDNNPATGETQGRADQIALADLQKLKDWRVFLCGHPEMVRSARKKAFLAGASMKDIYADPFVLSAPAS